jgi:hypothetical protein
VPLKSGWASKRTVDVSGHLCAAGSPGSAVVCQRGCDVVLASVRLVACTLVAVDGAQVACTDCSSNHASPAFFASGMTTKLVASKLAVQCGACAVCGDSGAALEVQGASIRGCSDCGVVVANGATLSLDKVDVRDCRAGEDSTHLNDFLLSRVARELTASPVA